MSKHTLFALVIPALLSCGVVIWVGARAERESDCRQILTALEIDHSQVSNCEEFVSALRKRMKERWGE